MRSDKCKKGGFDSFLSFLLLTKACSNGQSNLGHVCANLRRSWCILRAYPSPCWHVSPNVGALLRLLVEVCWKWLGLWDLCWRLCCCYCTFLRRCSSTWLLFLCRWTWAGSLLRHVRITHRKNRTDLGPTSVWFLCRSTWAGGLLRSVRKTP